MPVEINITDEDITHAERILLADGKGFSDQAKDFIRNLRTVDLQAVPGSGKTTVLLAKLLILERYLPFENGSGILVISHTNTAVNEIKDRIGHFCPKLFSYPNFIGTIQSFVNQYLTIPYYGQVFKKRLHRIDDTIYSERHYIPYQAQGWLSNRPDKDKILYTSRLLNGGVLGYDLSKDGQDFPLKHNQSSTYIALVNIKKMLLGNGILCFDDAYILAKEYITIYPAVKTFLQKRFQYVFVDEMQDMDKHQYDLLEDLFYGNGSSANIYQRVGDKNQAIYSGVVKLEDIWMDRPTVLPLTGSCRLPKAIAEAANPFSITKQQIEGLNNANENGEENNILPHVLIFDDDTIENVVPAFCKLVGMLQNEGKIPIDHKHGINAIAWRSGNDGKFGLKNYWNPYESASKLNADRSCLMGYLLSSVRNNDAGLGSIYNGITDAMIKVLRIEEIKNPENNRYFTSGSLNKFLRETHEKLYEQYKLRLYWWCCNVYKGLIDETYKDMKATIPKLLKFCFSIDVDKATHFLDADASQPKEHKYAVTKSNTYQCKETGIEVKMGTVHSAKGETHTATLYLESEYYGKYESDRLDACFSGKEHDFSQSKDKDVRKKEAIKMVYVGFSRPTHLLCYAVHKDRYNQEAFQKKGWISKKIYKQT